MEIVTILIVLVDQFYFNMHQPIKIWLFEKITFELVFIFAFSFSFKTICILLAQVIALKKIVISSAQFAISMPWSPICISLILLATLIKLTSTSAAILSNSTESWHPWQTHIRVKGSDRRPFVLILDSTLVYVNEFVSISELMESRKDKINSNDTTERFLLSLFD